MLNSSKPEISTAHTIKYRQMKKFLVLSLSDGVFIMLINVKISTIYEQHGKKFYNPEARSKETEEHAQMYRPAFAHIHLRIEIQILKLHWMMKNISYFNVCEAGRFSKHLH